MLALELFLGLAQRRATTLRRAQVLWQLIAARISVELILGFVCRSGLGEDFSGDLPVVTFDSGLAFAFTFVPSIAITPTFTNPAFAHSESTWEKSSASGTSWRSMKRAIVA